MFVICARRKGTKNMPALFKTPLLKLLCDICGSFGHATSNCTVSRSVGVVSGSMDKSNKEVDPANLYVGYLSHAIDENRLKEIFLPFGKILSTEVIKDPATGFSKGYGFVKFETSYDAAAAVTYMNGYKMDGKTLAVRVAGKKTAPTPAAPIPAAPNSILGLPSYINGPMVTMLPEAPLMPPPYILPHMTGPMATSSFSSGYDFCDKIPTSLPESVSRFPGHPDYTGSQFNSYFTSPTMNESQIQIPETGKRSSFWSAPHFP